MWPSLQQPVMGLTSSSALPMRWLSLLLNPSGPEEGAHPSEASEGVIALLTSTELYP